jgi:hypothetical protein
MKQFLLCITLDINVNTKPAIHPTDKAIEQRLIEQPFRSKFVTKKKVDEDNFRFLGNKKYERDSWLNKYKMDYFYILLEYLDIYLENDGNIELTEKLIERKKQYLLESDDFYGWYNENYEFSENDKDVIKIAKMFKNFECSSYFKALTKRQQRKGRNLLKIELKERNLFENYYDRKIIDKKEYHSVFLNLKRKSEPIEIESDDDEEE